MALAARRESTMERKIISISSKRQVTIPQKYFELLGFDDEAECILQVFLSGRSELEAMNLQSKSSRI